MFHAGAVIPSSVLLLQLLIAPDGDLGPPSVVLEELEPPVSVGLSALSLSTVGLESGLKVVEPLALLFTLGPLSRPKPGEVSPPPFA